MFAAQFPSLLAGSRGLEWFLRKEGSALWLHGSGLLSLLSWSWVEHSCVIPLGKEYREGVFWRGGRLPLFSDCVTELHAMGVAG